MVSFRELLFLLFFLTLWVYGGQVHAGTSWTFTNGKWHYYEPGVSAGWAFDAAADAAKATRPITYPDGFTGTPIAGRSMAPISGIVSGLSRAAALGLAIDLTAMGVKWLFDCSGGQLGDCPLKPIPANANPATIPAVLKGRANLVYAGTQIDVSCPTSASCDVKPQLAAFLSADPTNQADCRYYVSSASVMMPLSGTIGYAITRSMCDHATYTAYLTYVSGGASQPTCPTGFTLQSGQCTWTGGSAAQASALGDMKSAIRANIPAIMDALVVAAQSNPAIWDSIGLSTDFAATGGGAMPTSITGPGGQNVPLTTIPGATPSLEFTPPTAAPVPVPDPTPVTPPASTTQPTTPPADNPADVYNTKYPVFNTWWTPVYVNGVKGVWDKYSASLSQAPLVAGLKSLAPSFTGTATCPSFSLPDLDMVVYKIKLGKFDIACWIWDAIGAILLISAGFACRGIIFGG